MPDGSSSAAPVTNPGPSNRNSIRCGLLDALRAVLAIRRFDALIESDNIFDKGSKSADLMSTRRKKFRLGSATGALAYLRLPHRLHCASSETSLTRRANQGHICILAKNVGEREKPLQKDLNIAV